MRFYFHIRDKSGLIPDEEGSELSGISEAIEEALLSARDFAADDLRRGTPITRRDIEIVDEDGVLLETIPVHEVLN
jgi:hypothetical protein